MTPYAAALILTPPGLRTLPACAASIVCAGPFLPWALSALWLAVWFPPRPRPGR